MDTKENQYYWLIRDNNLSLAAIDAIRWFSGLDQATDCLYNWLSGYRGGKTPGGELWTRDGIRYALNIIGEYGEDL